MDPNRQKQEQQKPAHQQQRRSIVEGMARTGIDYKTVNTLENLSLEELEMFLCVRLYFLLFCLTFHKNEDTHFTPVTTRNTMMNVFKKIFCRVICQHYYE
jgi:hypothetical protein